MSEGSGHRAHPVGDPSDPGRRRFLKGVAIAVGAAAGAPAISAAPARAATPAELAEEHAGDPGMLIDLTRCIGCGSCVTACKLQNGLEFRAEQPALGPEAELASENWSVVRTYGSPGGEGSPRYVKRQCFHCLEPACASACWVRALEKSPDGPVTYTSDRCIGCRYCMVACPFGVPTFQWDEALPLVSKCSLCFERTSRGEATACAAACPAGAIRFGTRGGLLEAAWERIEGDPTYVRHVYGETEAGGTSVMYVSDVSFEELGFTTGVPERPFPDRTWQITRTLPPAIAALGAVLAALMRFRKRMAGAHPSDEGAFAGEGSRGEPPAEGGEGS